MRGIYILIVKLNENVDVTVGALGRLHFSEGLYAYVGSAQNSIEARIERHFRREKRKFWHIDYLLDHPASKIVKTYVSNASKAQECKIARELSQKGLRVAGFGCSDCRCASHLERLDNYEPSQLARAGFTAISRDY
jgi:Uri superfamily endonuclease